ncbi:SprB repeat-containing protein, partial [Croceitalea sp. P059]
MIKITFKSLNFYFVQFSLFLVTIFSSANSITPNNYGIYENLNDEILTMDFTGITCEVNLLFNVSTVGLNNGSAEVMVTGGDAPFTYMWDNGETTKTAIALAVGVRTVVVKDCQGNSTECSVTIECKPSEEICDGFDNDGDGEIDEGFDADHDGVSDCEDICEGGDDKIDTDGDGIPDACDDCSRD